MLNLDNLPRTARLAQLQQQERFLSAPALRILRLIYESEEPVSKKDLSASLHHEIEPAYLSSLLHRLVKKGALIQPARGWYTFPELKA